MLPVFNLLLDEVTNISQSKLDYAIREEVFSQHINVPQGLQEFVNSTWDKSEGLSLNGALYNNQDVFYLHSAASKIHIILNGIKSDKGNEYLSSFHQFVLDQVMIIVNAVESHIPGEKVFKNLNSNKVPLTEVDLIKGLLLTRIARNDGGSKKHFREIIEIRSSLGRKWDEMAAIANEPAFSSFFFRELKGFEGMLLLVAKMNGFKETEANADGHFPLFNFFNGQIEDVGAIFQELILCFSVLSDWYATPQIYNLLGFVFFTKSKGFKKRDFIQANLKVSKRDLLNALNSIKSTRLHSQPDKLKYGKEDDEIFNILLALSVFPKIEYMEEELREHKFCRQ